MLTKILQRFIRPKPPAAPAAKPRLSPNSPNEPSLAAAPRRQTPTPATPVYPPSDFGIAYDPVDTVIQAQADILRRLRLLAGTDDSSFDRLYMTVIRNLAEHINQLPATESGTHNGPGGLFRLALEVGFYALQSSEAAIFSGREGAEKRRIIEPRWRYATFLAGVCLELHRPITSMIVVTPDGEEWPAFQMSLGSWLATHNTDRFFVRWQSGNTSVGSVGQGAASYMVYKIIPESCLQYLHEAGTKIVPTMLDAIMGTVSPGSVSPIFRILEEVRGKVMKRDEAIRPANYGKATVGTHLEPHLLDAMRRLFKDGTWKVNEKKARLWYGKDGLFLVWKTAAKEMLELLVRDGVTGIPKDSQTLLDILQKTNVFQLDADGGPYWTIMPPNGTNELIALRFTNPLTLFGDSYEEPVPVERLQRGNGMKPVDAPQAELRAPAPEVQHPPQMNTAPIGTVDTATGEITTEAPATPAAEKTPEPSAAKPAPAISDVTESDIVELPKDIQQLFTPLTRNVIGCLLDDHHSGKTRGETGKVDDGFAITVERLAGYGADALAVIGELHKAGWLYTQPEKPNKKIHQVKMNNKETQVVIIKSSAARDAGFIK